MSDELLQLYEKMFEIRGFELKLEELFAAGEFGGTLHLSVGQEACAVGAIRALEDRDWVVSNHRGHGHFLARGGEPGELMAEIYGRKTGVCGGRGGTQHLASSRLRFVANGVTGGGLPVATGLSLASKLKGTGAVALVFFGDGAANQGTFGESLNLASIWGLPVVFLCENNQYAMSTPAKCALSVRRVALRAPAYGMPGTTVDGNDVLAVRGAVAAAAARAREGKGPSLVECRTYRFSGHSKSDTFVYRTRGEERRWRRKDPLERTRKDLAGRGVGEEILKAAEERATGRVEEAVRFARSSPVGVLPLPISEPPAAGPEPSGGPEKFYWQAIQEALCEEMEKDESVLLIGEDVAEYGGAFGVTRGMLERFGPERVRNTPISEGTITGCAVGAAIGGLRPVVEIMFMDFLTLAMDQLFNHGAKFPFVFGGDAHCGFVLRTPSGGRRGYGPTHSQSLEGLLMSLPGLAVVAPSSPADAKGLLKSALRSPIPVVFVEHKLLYGKKGPVPEGDYSIPLGKAKVARAGSDVTVAAFSYSVLMALEAAGALSEKGISCEVIDLRSLVPWDIETLLESVRKTQRLVVVEEGPRRGGVGSEIAASLQEEGFGLFDAPILRVGARDLPIPAGLEMERAVLPGVADIAAAVERVLG